MNSEIAITGIFDYFVPSNRSLRDALESHQYNYAYAEFNEGHSWGNWRAHLDDLLIFLFPHN